MLTFIWLEKPQNIIPEVSLLSNKFYKFVLGITLFDCSGSILEVIPTQLIFISKWVLKTEEEG